MKKLLFLSVAMFTGAACTAQDFGRVISSTPVMQQVAVPRQVCTVEPVAVKRHTPGAGAAIGAIAGGVLGNTVGTGGGRTAATMIGLIGGAILGHTLQGPSRTQVQDVQRCETRSVFESRPVAYDVVYDYAGRRYTVQTPQDPGPTIAVQVSPVVSGSPAWEAAGRPGAGPQYGVYDSQQDRAQAGYGMADADRHHAYRPIGYERHGRRHGDYHTLPNVHDQ